MSSDTPVVPVSPAPRAGATEVVYEVNVEVDPPLAAAYDTWLSGHIDRILALPGFLAAEVLRREPVAEGERAGWQRRTVHYRLASESDLKNYFEHHAARMRAEGIERFGDRFHAERRVLSRLARHDGVVAPPVESPAPTGAKTPIAQPAAAVTSAAAATPATAACRNCGTSTSGQYCPACGQRSPVRVLTLWELIKEATDDLTHSDSRVWRTLIPLMFKPGELTREYLLGRRARYLPPFRLYLVLSVLCFLTLGLGNDDTSARVVEEEIRAAMAQMTPEERAAAEEKLRRLQDLRETGPPRPLAEADPQATPGAAPRGGPGKINCESIDTSSPALTESARGACRKLTAEGGLQRFNEELLDNVPMMMFVFLPLIAAASFLLHAFSGRYYVEHLLFFVHFHAFVFASFIVQGLLAWPGEWLPPLEILGQLFGLLLVFYFPIYLYKGMRRVFGQRRWLAIPKFVLLSIAYVVCLGGAFIALILYTGWSF